MYEKRVYIRVPVGLEGTYRPMEQLVVPRLGITRDMSLGGARFASAERLDPGGKVAVSMTLPKEGEIHLTGIVVWSRIASQGGGQVGYESGLCWENVDTRAQAKLNSFLTDYTRPESVMVSQAPHERISLLRAAALGLAVSLALGAIALAWLRNHDLGLENLSLKNAIQNYQNLIERVTRLL